MAVDRVLAVGIPLLGSAEAAAAVGASLRCRREGVAVDAALAARLDAVLDALGILDAVQSLSAREMVGLSGQVESVLGQSADLAANPARTAWDHSDPRILLAQGQFSTLLAPHFREFVVPSLGSDLQMRLAQPRASFLDVGTGVAALAIAMCQLWPELHVVGIDPWAFVLEVAREQVAAAGLGDRIDLRQTRVEALEDLDRHDLAWVPTFFIPETAIERAIERVHAALRPGGYAILGLYARPEDPVRSALADLRTVRQGGTLCTPRELETRLRTVGFEDVEEVFDPAWRLPLTFVTGRR
jgi:SAM-dependent methyltransferase